MTRAQPQRPGTWAGKMLLHGKVLAAKADDLSLGLGPTWCMERTDIQKLSRLASTCLPKASINVRGGINKGEDGSLPGHLTGGRGMASEQSAQG